MKKNDFEKKVAMSDVRYVSTPSVTLVIGNESMLSYWSKHNNSSNAWVGNNSSSNSS